MVLRLAVRADKNKNLDNKFIYPTGIIPWGIFHCSQLVLLSRDSLDDSGVSYD